MTNIDMNQYLGAFLDETSEQLQSLNDLLLSLEKSPDNPEPIDEIFRIAHTLKGMSATMGFEGMAHLTHAMEDLLDQVRKGETRLSQESVNLLFLCLDVLSSMAETIRGEGREPSDDVSELIDRLHEEKGTDRRELREVEVEAPQLTIMEKEWVTEARRQGMTAHEIRVLLSADCSMKAARAYMVVSRLGDQGEIIKTVPSVEDLEKGFFDREFWIFFASHEEEETLRKTVLQVSEVENVFVKELEDPEDEEDPAGEAVASVGQKASGDSETSNHKDVVQDTRKLSRTVRVDIGRLDKLMNLVGELVIGRARIERLAQEARIKAFEEPLAQLGRISGDIQELVTKLRMVPVSFVFDRFPRLVRDLSKSLGKEIRLELEGKETELDRNLIDEIGDPMIHLIRNSIDHGVEKPEERLNAGKAKAGTVTIASYQEGNSVIIEVRDDGKGIDPEKVRRKAVDKGILSREEAQTLSDDDAVRLVLLPGFSTAEEVTDLSGRGVGMDAVKNKVESLGGQFQVESQVGKGTRVVVRLPLTLAIVVALLIRVGDETYAISLENVEETLLVGRSDIRTVHGSPVTTVRGEILSLSDLAAILGTPVERNDVTEYPVVVVRNGNSRIGFIVDELIGQQEIVIKPLGRLFSKVKGVAGATILGDGNVALILEPGSVQAI